MHAALDLPVTGSHLGRGWHEVRGWAFHDHRPVLGVVVTVNGQPRAVVPATGSRPDVAAAIPGHLGAETCGWSAAIDLTAPTSTAVTVGAYAVLGGSSGDDGPDQVRRIGEAECTTLREAGGWFDGGATVYAGWHRLSGAVWAPDGVSHVTLTRDGQPLGSVRLQAGPRSTGRVDDGHPVGFEAVVHVPSASPGPTFGGEATTFDGTRVELRPWTPSVEQRTMSAPIDRERLDLVRQRSAKAAPPPVWQADGPVLIATHDLGTGGAQLYLQTLLRRLRGRGLEMVVASPRGGMLVDELEDLGIPVHITAPADVRSPEHYESHVAQVMTLASSLGCRAVLANTMNAFWGADAGQRLGLDVVWAIHESFPFAQYWFEVHGAGVHPYVIERAAGALAGSTRVVFEAEGTHDLLRPLIGEDAGAVVPYGVDTEAIDRYRASTTSERLRAELGISEATTVLVCVGTIEPRKGQVNLAEVFAGSAVVAAHDVVLVLVGAVEGEVYLDDLRQVVASHGGDRIRIEPVQQDVYRWYQVADVLVSASDVESLPRTMLEAMTFARPVAATAVFGVPDLVEDGVSGYLCQARDLRALLQLVERTATTSRPELAAMGRAARQTVLDRHDPRVYEDYFLDALAPTR